jgi:hypothetical protein
MTPRSGGWATVSIAGEPFPGRGIPLGLRAGPVHCYLHVMHTLVQKHGVLVTDKSSFGLYLDQELDSCVLHYDFDRDPGNPYPPAHLQVEAASPAFDTLCGRLGRRHELARVHLPVGGKRFRPCLEDLIETLVVAVAMAARAAPRPLRATVDRGKSLAFG